MFVNLLNGLAPWSLPMLLLGLALALAFGRRHTIWLLALALLAWVSLPGPSTGGMASVGTETSHTAFAQLWLPLLLLLISAVRDPGLWSLRAMLWLGLLLTGWWLLQAPLGRTGIWLTDLDAQVLARIAPLSLGTTLTLLAAALSLLRWTLRGWPIDLGNALGTLVLAAAIGSPDPQLSRGLFALAGVVFAAGVLWAAYRMAFVDPLTGLANRRALDEKLASSGWRLALAMVDVDFFKKLNDRYGHDNGDLVLRAVARELGRTRGARAYRYGGEEFCLVFAGRQIARADEVLEGLRTRIEAMRVPLAGGAPTSASAQAIRKGQRNAEVGCTVSIGVAQRAADRRTPEAVLKAADQALYKAKQKGRNRVISASA
jgi:diguanylate cyclase (GGDEF)-like protein